MARTSKASNLTVGYKRLPSSASSGQKAAGKEFTQSTRSSMEAVLTRFRDFINSLKGATPEALEMALTPTFEKSQTYCPQDTGALLESGDLTSGISTGGVVYARISYGSSTGIIHYAPIVHERTDLHHESPTRSKWLQAAVEEDLNKMRRRFTIALKKLSGLGGS